MFCLETQHFRLNRILLLAIGLWPYQQSKFVRLQVILLFGILTSYIIFQLTVFVTAECTPNLIMKVFSMALFSTIYVIKYNSFHANAHNIRFLLEQLQDICNELKDETEINIIKKYGNNAKRYTAILLLCTVCGIFAIIMLPIWPRILGVILQINESQPHRTIYIVTEYFVDQEKYFYLILLHMDAVVCIGTTTVTATGTMLIAYIKHICGMFRIACYRIEQAMTIEMLKNVSLENENVICRKIICAVDIHRKAMKFCEVLSSTFEGSFFMLIMTMVTSMSLNFFAAVLVGNKEEFVLHFLLITVILSHMFFTNYLGQELMNYNDRVYATAYNVQWYNAPLHAQKLLLFIIQRSSMSFNLNIGGIIVASLECFATLIKASMSYFTVMYSTQQ